MEWTAGYTIQQGRYTIEQVLGQGGFGITYRARDQRQGSQVVIKTPNTLIQKDPNFEGLQQGFLNEALRLAKCSHKYIVQVYEIVVEAGLVCIVMEYISGEPLERRLRNKGALLEFESLHYTRQIGSALSAMHSQDYLHRDIKPANILLRQSLTEAILIDFGLARNFSQGLIQHHTSWGTDGYAPIEQYDSLRRRGAWIDVYALAATLYTMVTGQIPVCAPARASGCALDQPKFLNPSLSDQINEAILQGMAFYAEDRPATIQEWLDLLPKFESPISTQDLIDLQKSLNPSIPCLQTPGSVSSSVVIPELLQPTKQPFNPYVKTPLSSIPSEMSVRPKQTKPLTLLVPAPEPESNQKHPYRQLWLYLKEQNWAAADQETTQLMLTIGGCDRSFSLEAMQAFPDEHLRVIDKVWKEFSKGHFSFSAQQALFLQCQKKSDLFGLKVGWIRGNHSVPYSELNFSLQAPKGHLPLGFLAGYSGGLKSALLVLDRYWIKKLTQGLGTPTQR